MFNLILGIETLAKFGTILDFQNSTIQIDHAVVAMRPYTNLANESNMWVKTFNTDDMYVPPSTGTFTRNHPEPISTKEATKRTIEILDANYEKRKSTRGRQGHLRTCIFNRAEAALVTTYHV